LGAAAANNETKVWDAATGKEIFAFKGKLGNGYLAFSPDGLRLATAGRVGPVRLWDLDTGQQIMSVKGPSGEVTCVAFSPDGNRLAAGGVEGAEGIVKVWDAGPLGR
jgi:WD40 repeat protein